MSKLSAKEERRLLSAVERSIDLANTGLSPNDAIEKVAREEKYTPPFIERMVTAFNKSHSVARFTKEAEVTKRKETFPLANTDVIVRKIYTEDKEASVKEVLTFPGSMREALTMKKEAAAKDPLQEYKKLHPRHMAKRADACKSAWEKLAAKMTLAEETAKLKLEESLSKTAMHLSRMSDKDLQKVAQLLVNGYPESGADMCRLLSNKTRRNIPVLEKQANCAVFPMEEPYISITELWQCTDTYAKSMCDKDYFQKYAEGFVGDLVGTVGKVLQGSEGLASDKDVAKAKNPEDELDPAFFNALKEVDARKNFADLALYDQDLDKYDMPTLIKAYNNASSMTPEAVSKQPILKALMLQSLNTGNLMDPAMIEKNLKINKEILGKNLLMKAELERIKEKSKGEAKPWFEVATGLVGEADKKQRAKLDDAIKKRLDKGTDSDKDADKDFEKYMGEQLKIGDPNSHRIGKALGVGEIIAEAKANGIDLGYDDVVDAFKKQRAKEPLEASHQAAIDAASKLRGW